MKKKTKLLPIFIAFAIIVSAFTTQATKLCTTDTGIISASEKASVSRILSLYKDKKYKKAKKMCKKLPQSASEQCEKNMSAKMKKAYLRKVKSYKTDYDYGYSKEEHILDYYLADITNNGKAELIVRHAYTDIATSSCTIYKYKKGKAIKLGTIQTSHTYLYAYPNHSGIIGAQKIMGCETVERYYVKHSKMQTKKIGHREDIPRVKDYIEFPYELEGHASSEGSGISYDALQ